MTLKKEIFLKIALFALLSLGIVLVVTATFHALETGTIYDDARSDTAVAKGTTHVVFAVVGLLTSIAGTVLLFKGKNKLALILVIAAIVSFVIAFSVVINDQYTTKNSLNAYEMLYQRVGTHVSTPTAPGYVAANIAGTSALVEKGIVTSQMVHDVAYAAQIKAGADKATAAAAAKGAQTAFETAIKSDIFNGVAGLYKNARIEPILSGINKAFMPKVETMLDNSVVEAKRHLYSINLVFFSGLTAIALINSGLYLTIKEK